MNKIEVRCSNCGTSFVITNGGAPMSELLTKNEIFSKT